MSEMDRAALPHRLVFFDSTLSIVTRSTRLGQRMPCIRRLRGRGHRLSDDLGFLEAICFPGDFWKQITGCSNAL